MMMDLLKEDTLLEAALGVAETDGYAAAYAFLLAAAQAAPENSGPQTLYFLACLAGGSGRADTALAHLAEAIDRRGWWYRPEVLEDDDLACLGGCAEFARLCAVSAARHTAAAAAAQPTGSWHGKYADSLLLAVHGNTQNAETARHAWQPLTALYPGWQLETVQSGTPDGFGTYRWEYDAVNYREFAQLAAAAQSGYAHTAWAGFSAGCDMLLRTVLYTPLRCDVLLLQSPWLPLLETECAPLCARLAEKHIRTVLLCGSEDTDCLPCARTLFDAAEKAGADCTLTVLPGVRHAFGEGFGPACRLPG